MSVVRGFRRKVEQEGAELVGDGRRPQKVSGIQKRAPKNPPACSVLNGQIVVSGNGEILLGPVTTGGGKRYLSITGDPGKCQAAERKSEGVVVADDGGGRHSPA